MAINPKELIYEVVDGQPIYYQNYKAVLQEGYALELAKSRNPFAQGLREEIIKEIETYLFTKKYQLVTDSVGLRINDKTFRKIDLAIYDKEELSDAQVGENYLLDVAPEIWIAIDTLADLSHFKNPYNYYNEKSNDVLELGGRKVIWIFTKTRKILTSQPNSLSFDIHEWDENIMISKKLKLNMLALEKQLPALPEIEDED